MLALDKGVRKDYRNGDVIFRPGDTLSGVSVVMSGCVVLTANNDDSGPDRSVLLGFLYPGDIFNQASLFYTDSAVNGFNYTASGQATTVNTLHPSLINEDFYREIAKQSTYSMVRAYRHITDICTLPVEERVLNLLITIAKSPAAITGPEGFIVRLTRIQISKMVGCTREMVGSVLKYLNNTGVLRVHGKQIIVPHEVMASPLAEGL